MFTSFIDSHIQNRWFHGRCVGLKKYQANSISTYVCPDCENAHQNSKKRKSDTSSTSTSNTKGRHSRTEISKSDLPKPRSAVQQQISNHL